MKYWLDKIIVLVCASLLCIMATAQKVVVVPMTLENMKQEMGCYALDPANCGPDEPWVLLFYNSTQPYQISKVQYLIQLYIKQVTFASSFSKSNVYEWPKFAIIDCFYSSNLCRSVCQTDLPLVLFNQPSDETVKYQGYITLAGLISFIKTHDPQTSKLAQYYDPACHHFISSPMGLSHKQIKKMAKKWRNKMTKLIENAQLYQNSQDRLPNNYKGPQGIQEELVIQESLHFNKTLQGTMNDATVDQFNYQQGQQYQQQPLKQIKQKQSRSKDSSKTQTPDNTNKKKEQEGFFHLVSEASKWVKDTFKSLGFSGFLLDFIQWVSYIFFFCFFGLLALLA